MEVNLYSHERCSDCGDIRGALKRRNVRFTDNHFPPPDPDINALSGNVTYPVLVDEEHAPKGVVGHKKILEWVEENYSESSIP